MIIVLVPILDWGKKYLLRHSWNYSASPKIFGDKNIHYDEVSSIVQVPKNGGQKYLFYKGVQSFIYYFV